MHDTLNRTLDYLRLSVTDRCNLRCRYCMPPDGIQKKAHDAILRNESFVRIASAMASLGVGKIRLTGGEPLVRRGLPSLLRDLNRLVGIREVTLTTNGILLAEQLDELMDAGLRRVNISLDSLRPDTYRTLTNGGNLADVLAGIERAQRAGLTPIKINVVLVAGVNTDEIPAFLALAKSGLEVRFIELMPVGGCAGWAKAHYANAMQLIAGRPDLVPLPDHGNSGPCRYYRLAEGTGVIGIINPLSDHFCQNCNRLRVTSDGMLRTCLHSNDETDLTPFLQDPWDMRAMRNAILAAVRSKPARHHLDEPDPVLSQRDMHGIGG